MGRVKRGKKKQGRTKRLSNPFVVLRREELVMSLVIEREFFSAERQRSYISLYVYSQLTISRSLSP